MKVIPTRRAVVVLAIPLAVVLLFAATLRHASPAEAFAAMSKATLINYLRSISGTSIIAGQHNKEPANSPSQYTQQAVSVTGQYPGLWGSDMMFTSGDIANRQSVIDEAKPA